MSILGTLYLSIFKVYTELQTSRKFLIFNSFIINIYWCSSIWFALQSFAFMESWFIKVLNLSLAKLLKNIILFYFDE